MSAIQQALFFQGASGVTYATWNPADKNAGITLSNGNLTATQGGASRAVRSTIGKASGKYYWELTQTGGGEADWGIGNSSASLSTWLGNDANGLSYDSSDGKLYKGGVAVATGGATYTTTHTIGIALDVTAGTVSFYKNNVAQYTAFSHGIAGTIYAMVGSFAATPVVTANFGATALTYTPPAGYNAGLYT